MTLPWTSGNWQRFFLEITNRCNFDCLFCPSGISGRPRRDMSRALAFDVVDQLRGLGFRGRIYFHMLGEPLLHPSVFEIVDRAAEVQEMAAAFIAGQAVARGCEHCRGVRTVGA